MTKGTVAEQTGIECLPHRQTDHLTDFMYFYMTLWVEQQSQQSEVIFVSAQKNEVTEAHPAQICCAIDCSGWILNCPSHILKLRATGDKPNITYKEGIIIPQVFKSKCPPTGPSTNCRILDKLLNSQPVSSTPKW